MNSNGKSGNRGILACTTAMCLACVFVALSAHAGDSRSETVKFGDLNLGTAAGVQALYGRIHSAAARVCQQPAGEQQAVWSCMTKAVSDAVAKVNDPALTAFYQEKTGTNPQMITASR